MGNDDKRQLRKLKREIKREGNRDRRRSLKRSLADNPDEAQFDDYAFGRNSSKPWNGFNQDKSRARDEEE